MGVVLFDLSGDDHSFSVNFWHWHAIVEAIRAAGALPAERVDALHRPFVGLLRQSEARAVAAALRTKILPSLSYDERLLLDGRRTTEPDDGKMHLIPEDLHRNYSTDRATLEEFAAFCRECDGFRVV